MIYSIAYDAVRKKVSTTPPNELIANTEMAAGIGIILSRLGISLNFEDIKEPEDIKREFLGIMERADKGSMSEEEKLIFERVEKYKVKSMVNETMKDLESLTKYEM